MASRRGLIFFTEKASPRVEVSFFFTEKTWPLVEALPFPLRCHPLEYEFTCYRLDEIRIVLAFSFGRIIDIDSM